MTDKYKNLPIAHRVVVEKAHKIHPGLAYFLAFKTQKPINVSWDENYKYVIFHMEYGFNTREMKDNGAIPKGYKVGKVVTRHYKAKVIVVEVNFVEDKLTAEHVVMREFLEMIANDSDLTGIFKNWIETERGK